jgi:transcriptional regulator with AAA-type ATPase domain/pSer/pThr/pTyr-binding forkhead associated (FHA) protein
MAVAARRVVGFARTLSLASPSRAGPGSVPEQPAMASDRNVHPRFFRLRVSVQGEDVCFTVRPGENVIGSRGTCDIALPGPGVSRRHALLLSNPDGLEIQDLGSKNGTYVNGARVERCRVAAGDAIRVGAIPLVIEDIEASDGELAISLDTPAETSTPSQATGTGTGESSRWPPAFEPLVARAMAGDASGALRIAAQELGTTRAWALSLARRRDPLVIASTGTIDEILARPDVLAALRVERGPELHDVILPGDPAVACAFCAGLALVVAGEEQRLRAFRVVLRAAALLLAPRIPERPVPPPPRQRELTFPPGTVAGRSPAMQQLYLRMRSLLSSDLPLLIVGETGVGKEGIAQALHASSPRADKPFVAINCAAIPMELLEPEMFGIERGVATGVTEREGAFWSANGGVVFLDEIGDMAPQLQGKLLRVLQERVVHPVGSRRALAVDVWVIAATNADLDARLADGRFRSDLYYRLAGEVLRVPPLRERRQDISPLVEHFIREGSSRSGKAVRGISVKALAHLEARDWPGNVRELEHEVRRLVSLCPHGQAIDAALLGPLTAPTADAPASFALAEQVNQLERELISQALIASGGNRSEAARKLGISRNGLAIKMERLGISEPV